MSDTQKYRAIGNSVAIPCVSFILERIAEVLRRAAA
jgi:site-specific DNA-cytosine methylase